jgi:hypothetical protein
MSQQEEEESEGSDTKCKVRASVFGFFSEENLEWMKKMMDNTEFYWK